MNTAETTGISNRSFKKLRVVMAGGGTGGHLFPAIAIAEAFLEKNPASDMLFVSTGKPFEKAVLADRGFRLRCIPVEGIKGRGIRNQFRALMLLPKGVREAFRILREFKPDLVVGVGSYSAGPLILAAWVLRIPVVLHEQNILPGITNRMLFPLASRVHVSFPDTRFKRSSDKIRFSGNPVRKNIQKCALHFSEKKDIPPPSDSPFTVGIIGGSQGAHAINLSVMAALPLLKECGYHLIHQTGESDWQLVQDAYRRYGISGDVRPFFRDMTECYRKADLMVCRSGATTVAEILVMGMPAIFVPFPHAADNHQELNAGRLVQARASEMIRENQLSGPLLAEKIRSLAADPERRGRMARNARALGMPFAAETIAEDCYSLVR